MEESAVYLAERTPRANDINFYFWYYGTLALYQHQGPAWKAWNRAVREILLPMQERKGPCDGSWPPKGQWATGGRVVQTALATLCLEVYYRYLPLYTRLGETVAAGPAEAPAPDKPRAQAAGRPQPAPANTPAVKSPSSGKKQLQARPRPAVKPTARPTPKPSAKPASKSTAKPTPKATARRRTQSGTGRAD